MRFIVVTLAVIGAAGAGLGVLLGWLQDYHPAFDSFSHFRLHFVAVLVASCVILALLQTRKVRWLALFGATLGAGWLALEFGEGPPVTGERGALRLVQFNLNFRNQAMDRVGEKLTAYDADVVTLQEVPPAHEAVLRGLTAYPHQAHCSFRDIVGGVSILSKHALSAVDCSEGQGLVAALVDTPGGTVTVASIHTYWPWPHIQHRQVDEWVPKLEKIIGPVIVAGDFNAAPWSHAVSKLAQASRTKVVPGIRMTIGVKAFPVVPAIPIPIDHVLLSEEFCATSAHVGEALGSDHYPVIVEVVRDDPIASTGCDQLR